MSFTLINRVDGSIIRVCGPGEYVDLTAKMAVNIEPLSTAVILHEDRVILGLGTYVIYPIAGIFMSHTLIVPTEHFEIDGSRFHDGSLFTPAFNFGGKRIRIEKGFSISRLVAL